MTAQQQINYGNTANDGQGDPLRTAFIKTDDNFDAIWAAGPVGSNVAIANNTLQVLNTNGSLTLSPNGIGDVRVTRPVVPNLNNTHDLGSTDRRFREIFVNNVTAGKITVQAVVTEPVPLANLTAMAGARAFVSDGNLVAAGNFGETIGSGGANTVPVWSDGSNWYIG